MDRPYPPDMPPPYDPYEDEIELMDLLKVLWKWKYLIIIGTLVCAVAAAVVSLNMTKVYGVTTVLQPGMLKVTEEGKTVYIDSPENIKAVIETGALNGQVLKNVQFPDTEEQPTSVEFKVTIPKNTNALEVVYETPYVDIGLQIMKNLNEGLLERYGRLVRLYEDNYNNEIHSKSNETSKLTEKIAKVRHSISTLEAETDAKISEIMAKISGKRSEIVQSEIQHEAKLSELTAKISAKRADISSTEAENETRISQIINNISAIKTKISAAEAENEKALKELASREATFRAQIDSKKKQINNLEQKISDEKTEINRISKNTDLLIEERNKFLSSSKKEETVLASMMYTNTIQQNIGYLNTLRGSVVNTNHMVLQERVGIEKLENDINDLNAQKENLIKQTRYSVEKLKADIEDLEAQKQGLTKQMTYRIQNLTAEINDLEAQKETSLKETKSKIENLQADIKDLEAQKESLLKQMQYKIETMESEIKELESEKELVLQDLKSLRFKRDQIQNIQINRPPRPIETPVKPKTRLNVLLAGVVGLFLTIFLSFFVEYISKYKSREAAEP
jgi:uncharacterized protein involved in exopolysaccharide biosynthesis